MKRLQYGKFSTMTLEEKNAHRRALRRAWEAKPENKEKVRALNRKYQKRRWKLIASSYFERTCKACGKTVMLKGKRTICDDCHAAAPTKQKYADIYVRSCQRKERNDKIINLAKTTNLTQKEIATQIGTTQPVVSYILRTNGLRRVAYSKRVNNDK